MCQNHTYYIRLTPTHYARTAVPCATPYHHASHATMPKPFSRLPNGDVYRVSRVVAHMSRCASASPLSSIAKRRPPSETPTPSSMPSLVRRARPSRLPTSYRRCALPPRCQAPFTFPPTHATANALCGQCRVATEARARVFALTTCFCQSTLTRVSNPAPAPPTRDSPKQYPPRTTASKTLPLPMRYVVLANGYA